MIKTEYPKKTQEDIPTFFELNKLVQEDKLDRIPHDTEIEGKLPQKIEGGDIPQKTELKTPVIVFAYNRPDHLEQTLEALSFNHGAKQTDLFIYCDGPKAKAVSKERGEILRVSQVAKAQKGFRSVKVIESAKNKGLAKSIISGVTTVMEAYDQVIVLEDDLITSPFFLKYMNETLEYYQKRKSVFSISSNRPHEKLMPIPKDYPYDVFVSLRNFSTGWATWKDRWQQVDWSMSYYGALKNQKEEIKAFNRGGEDLFKMLTNQKNRNIDSWSIQFTYAHFRNHAVSILPCIPLVDNIGFDGTGVHSGKKDADYRNNIKNAVSKYHYPDNIYEDRRIVNSFYNYYYKRRGPFWRKGWRMVLYSLHLDRPENQTGKIYK